ncbi:hypothetical protein G6F40_017345 [Rhizopus arrhizus]|nr:hypothetical protein G6F40_017345 [Rhizopus arrhizus]
MAGAGDASGAGRVHGLRHAAFLAIGDPSRKLVGHLHHRPGLYGAAAGGRGIRHRGGHDGPRATAVGGRLDLQHGLPGLWPGQAHGGRRACARRHAAAGHRRHGTARRVDAVQYPVVARDRQDGGRRLLRISQQPV